MTTTDLTPDGHVSALAEELQQQDWPAVAARLRGHWTDMLSARSAARTMIEALHALPEESLDEVPTLGLMATSVGRRRPRPSFSIIPTSEAQTDAVIRRGAASEVMEFGILALEALRRSGASDEAFALAETMLPFVKAVTRTLFAPTAEWATDWYMQAGRASLATGDWVRTYLFCSIGWNFRERDPYPRAAALIASYMTMLYALVGDTPQAEHWQREIEAREEACGAISAWIAVERARNTALLHLATDRLDTEAAEPLSAMLTDDMAFNEHWSTTLFGVVRHLIDTNRSGDAGRLMAVIEEMHSTVLKPGGFHASMLAITRVELALVLGQIDYAWSQHALVVSPILQANASLYGARLALTTEDYAKASRLAAAAEHQAAWERVVSESRVLRAAAELALGNKDEAAELIRTPGVFDSENRHALSLLPAHVNAQLREAFDLGDELPPTNALLAKNSAPRWVRLTPSEQRVLESLDSPDTIDELAKSLFISPNTFKTHLRAVYTKLGAASRSEAITFAVDRGLLIVSPKQ